MNAVRSFLYKFTIAAELLGFLWERKLWWLIPMVVMLLFFGILIVFGQSAGVAPFIYPIF